MTLQGIKRPTYMLEDHPLASGGEGAIYGIVGEPGLLAKIWLPKKRTQRRIEKIQWMARAQQAENLKNIAWPLDILSDGSSVCGFVMRKFGQAANLSSLLPKKEGNDELPWDKRIAVAVNLCGIVQDIHEMGQCIGDMNPKNFGVDMRNGHVYAYDADSFHFRAPNGRIYPCVVGLPEYYAPELQQYLAGGKSLETLMGEETFTQQTDNWTLAVLVFQLLFEGFHPFRGGTIKAQASAPVIKAEKSILNRVSPVFNPSPGMVLKANPPPLNIIPSSMIAMFRSALITDSRPTPQAWRAALLELRGELTKCPHGHLYWIGRGLECPWCEAAPKDPPKPDPPPLPQQTPVTRKWFTHEKCYAAAQVELCIAVLSLSQGTSPDGLEWAILAFLILGILCQLAAPGIQGQGEKEPGGIGAIRTAWLIEGLLCFAVASENGNDEQLAFIMVGVGALMCWAWWLMYREHKRNKG